MADHGHIKISRKAYMAVEVGGDPFWNERRIFSRWEAWEYMIQTAAFADHTRIVDGCPVEIARGHTPPLAISFLANAWGWGCKRVRNFLALLVEMDRIRAVGGTRSGTVYLIVNYDFYQTGGTQKGKPGDVQRASTGQARGKHGAGKISSKAGEAGKQKEPSIHQAHASLDDEDRISFVIRLANRGMNENPAIDPYRFRPILPQHGGSREAVAEWRAAGIDWSTIEAVVYDRAQKYQPSDRYPQINTLAYFRNAVKDAHERHAAMQIEPPSLAEHSEGWLHLVPAELREWAERLSEKLTADEIARPEAERVREHLARANEAETRRMRPAERDAYIGLRLLNWYGERVGDPKPARAAA